MSVLQIGILVLAATVIGQLRRGRQLAMLAVSVLVLFWLQPPEPFASLQFWLPLATLGIVVLSWILTSTPEVSRLGENWPALAVILGAIVMAELNRLLGWQFIFTMHPPAPFLVLLTLAGIAAFALVVSIWRNANQFLGWAALLGLVAIFVFLKTPGLPQRVEAILSTARAAGGAPNTAPLAWLGYSYLAFRLMHTIRDRQIGRLPAVPLSDYLNYAIFFPSFTAGPIDRLERFDKDLCAPVSLTNEDWLQAGTRLFGGLFKKFIIADLLAVISLNDALVRQVRSAPWMWVFLYAYAFRIYFDFGGYTDIAIGMGRLMGIRLPENFSAPYLKSNLTLFWNSWHMTLTQWFRAYVFNPFTRAVRTAKRPWPVWLVILIAQLMTMTLIGLWHGVTLTFILWGLWHGVGLFAHNRWSDFMRPRVPVWMQSGVGLRTANVVGVILTFNYVALGWTFFSLSTPAVAWLAIRKLLGFA